MSMSNLNAISLFRPTQKTQLQLLAFMGLPCCFVIDLFGTSLWNGRFRVDPQSVVGELCILLFFLILPTLFTVRHLTARIEIGQTEIASRSLFGNKTFQLRDVESAHIFHTKNGDQLSIRAGRNVIECWPFSFTEKQLEDIQTTVQERCAALSRTIKISRPDKEYPWLGWAVIAIFSCPFLLLFIAIAYLHHHR